jgi:predicted ATPase
LGLSGELSYEVKSLEAKAAVELFRDRALDAGKMLLHAERTIVAEICEMLDRVPLYIRMVATHMRSDESPAAILDGLRDAERRYPVAMDVHPHRQSREIAFRYTYERLDEHGQRLWAVMAGIFAGAPGRADVRAVYAHFKADLSLDALLLWSVVESADGHHHIFESAREFGRARLAEGVLGEEEGDFRARHAAYYLAYAGEHKDDCDAPAQVLPDILAGLAFFTAQATQDEDDMREYARVVDEFLEAHGYWLHKGRWRQGVEA